MKSRIISPSRLSFPLAAALAALFSTSSHAQSLYWDSNSTTADAGATPTGTWGVDNFWNTDSTGGAGGAFQTATLGTDDLFFSAGTDAVNAYTISLNSATQLARLVTFEDGTATLNTGTLSLGNLGGLTVTTGTVTGATIISDLTIAGSQTFNVAAARTLTLDTGTFTRSAGATLNVLSTGTVTTTMTNLAVGSLTNDIISPWASFGSGASTRYATIDGSNNIVAYTGGTAAATAVNVTSTLGTVNYDVAGGNAALGAGANINTLRYTGPGATISGALTTKGIMNVSGNALTFSGAFTGGAGGTVINAANGGIAFSSTVNNGGGMLIFDGAGATSIGNTVLTGAGGLTKSGTGTLSLNYGSGNNPTYGGPTILNGGILRLGGGGSGNNLSGLPTGNITVNGGVFDVYWGNTFTRNLGSGTSNIQIIGGVSGFSQLASGQTLVIKLNNNNTPIVWGSTFFSPTALVLNTVNGFGTVDFQNYVNFDGVNRTVEVNAGSSTMSGILSNGGLIKTGNGQLALTNANSYTGGTTISAGTLRFATKTSMPATGNVAVSDGATLGVNLGTAATVWSNGTSGAGTLGGLLAGVGGQAGSTVSYTGNVRLHLEVVADVTYSSSIANVGTTLRLIKSGGNTLTLSGDNSYTGGTTLSAGTLSIGHANALGTGTGTIALNGGTIQSSSATPRTFSNPVTIGGDFTVGGTGDLTFSNTGASALGATRTITVNTGRNATFAQAFSGSAVGITKAGAGNLTLTGNNTYTGATTISAGKIVLNNDGDVTGSAVAFSGSNSGLTVTGGSGIVSTWNLNGGNFETTDANLTNVQVLIDGAGTAGSARVTNVNILEWGRTAANSTLSLTNGGQMTVNGEVRTGNTYYNPTNGTNGNSNITIGGGTATSTFTGNTGQAFYIGYGEREGSNNNVVTVSTGGVLTSVGNMFVGHVNNQQGNDLASTANKLTVTGTGTASMVSVTVGYAQAAGVSVSNLEMANANIVEVTSGGTLTTSGVNYIGRAVANFTQANSNTMTITGTGSSWAAGSQNVNIGFTANAGATSNNNILTVGAGGTVTGVAALTVGSGTGTETGNQLVINGSLTATSVSVSASNSLSGIGSITGPVTVNGTLTPGNAGIGTLTTVGNLSFGSTGIYSVGVDATSVTSDQTSVTGTVAINAATTLSASVSGTLAGSQKFFVVVNDGLDAVTGTFSGFAQDAVVGTFSGTDLKISYVGDSVGGTTTGGNDIVLYVDGGDAVPPTLTSITDNVTGGPVNIGATVTYTVTFSEDIGDASVTAVDFNNNGTAGITVGAINETTPGVFTVAVTANSPGSLKLRIPTGAVIEDVALNDLVVPVEDDTTITVRTIYDTWANATYSPALTMKLAGDDQDGDTFINLMEFAFGTQPTVSSAGSIVWVDGGAVTMPGQPVAVNFANPGVDYRAVFGRRKDYAAAGLTYTVEFSAGLNVWVPSADTPTVLTGAGGLNPSEIEAVSVPYPLLIDVGGNNFKKPTFFRLTISN